MTNDIIITILRSIIRSWARNRNHKFESALVDSIAGRGFQCVISSRKSASWKQDSSVWFTLLVTNSYDKQTISLQLCNRRLRTMLCLNDYYSVDLAAPDSFDKLEAHLDWVFQRLWEGLR